MKQKKIFIVSPVLSIYHNKVQRFEDLKAVMGLKALVLHVTTLISIIGIDYNHPRTALIDY